jgi:hypothetical protein
VQRKGTKSAKKQMDSLHCRRSECAHGERRFIDDSRIMVGRIIFAGKTEALVSVLFVSSC